MENKPVVVFITVPNRDTAKNIARLLVESRLAACVNILAPIESVYIWQGATQEEEEVLLVVKTRAELLEERLIPAVQAAHPYQVPEIIALPILSGLPDYLAWIGESTT